MKKFKFLLAVGSAALTSVAYASAHSVQAILELQADPNPTIFEQFLAMLGLG